MSIQSIIVRCDAARCITTTNRLDPDPGCSVEERHLNSTQRVISDFCPVHTDEKILAKAKTALSILGSE